MASKVKFSPMKNISVAF